MYNFHKNSFILQLFLIIYLFIFIYINYFFKNIYENRIALNDLSDEIISIPI